MKTISVQSKNKPDVFFEISIEEAISPYVQYVNYLFLNKLVNFVLAKEQKCLKINSFLIKDDIKKFLKEKFGFQASSSQDIYISITDKSWDEVQEIEAEFKKRKQDFLDERQAIIDKLPVKYYMYDSFDWGDYTSDKFRQIMTVRDRLDDEAKRGNYSEGIVVRSLNFDNKGIANYEEEWNEDLKNAGGEINDSKLHEIPAELAEKWNNIHIELVNIKLEKEAEKERMKKEADEKEVQRRKDCFEEAKKTGQPVLLYSYFLSGNDIPRKFREEDSDMGDLLTYAMPDGTIKEKFSHAY